ncbi:hypothetical protein FGIG_06829 [Fasciola gigantica]|uniref:Uncharacterized protein n=1 Tax=Fasciola gigantica TaxID=46835 RepID=A0A504Z014_FASGI|nr:hypothetical protein FGIG_06829 [Fasciola gigantica]
MDSTDTSSEETPRLSFVNPSIYSQSRAPRSKITETVDILPDELRRWRTRDMLTNLMQNLQFRITGLDTTESPNGTGDSREATHHLHIPDYHHIWSRHTAELDYEERLSLGRAFQVGSSRHQPQSTSSVLVLDRPRIVNAKEPSGRTLLLMAADQGSYDDLDANYSIQRMRVVDVLFFRLRSNPNVRCWLNLIGKILITRGKCFRETNLEPKYFCLRARAHTHTDPNAVDCDGNCAIHLAVRRCKIDVVELLIQHGANIMCSNKHGVRPIHLACETNFLEGLKVSEQSSQHE